LQEATDTPQRQQWNKRLRFKGAAASRKQEAFNKTIRKTFGLEVAK
jgi:hypothetical protein